MSNDRDTTADGKGRLSDEEATELAGQVAALARSGLPLEPGLRALAGELPGVTLPVVLLQMASSLEAGVSLDEVILSQGSRFPAHVRGLLLVGIRSGHLPEVMEQFVDLHRARRELGRRVWLSLAYPILLMSLLSILFILFDQFVVDYFAQIFYDFDAALPAMTRMFLSTRGSVSWVFAGGTVFLVLAVFLLTAAIPTAPGVSARLYRIPLIGPLWRWGRLVQFARLMGLLLGQGTPLPEALRLTAEGVQDAYLAEGCRRVAREVEAGRRLSESLASYRQFPPTLIPLIDWGQNTSALPDAFAAAAEMFEGNVETQGVLMETALLPIIFLIITVFISFFMTGMLMPLISLITMLSSWGL